MRFEMKLRRSACKQLMVLLKVLQRLVDSWREEGRMHWVCVQHNHRWFGISETISFSAPIGQSVFDEIQISTSDGVGSIAVELKRPKEFIQKLMVLVQGERQDIGLTLKRERGHGEGDGDYRYIRMVCGNRIYEVGIERPQHP